ncbi:hypothetical protein GGI42DRAFT_287976 [Trichoderma sp. SZMC 28013]
MYMCAYAHITNAHRCTPALPAISASQGGSILVAGSCNTTSAHSRRPLGTLTGSRCCRQPPYLTAYWSQVICMYAAIAQESGPFQVVSQPERRFGSSLFFFVSISFFPSFPIRIFTYVPTQPCCLDGRGHVRVCVCQQLASWRQGVETTHRAMNLVPGIGIRRTRRHHQTPAILKAVLRMTLYSG